MLFFAKIIFLPTPPMDVEEFDDWLESAQETNLSVGLNNTSTLGTSDLSSKLKHYDSCLTIHQKKEISVITEEDRIEFINRLRVTDEEIEWAESLPQRGDDWHKLRKGRITASMFGPCAGHGYKEKDVALMTILWPDFIKSKETEFSREIMERGTILEPIGFEMAQVAAISHYRDRGYTDIWIEETGIKICKDYPWLAASSDEKYLPEVQVLNLLMLLWKSSGL